MKKKKKKKPWKVGETRRGVSERKGKVVGLLLGGSSHSSPPHKFSEPASAPTPSVVCL